LQRGQCGFEFRLAEPEIAQITPDVFGKFRRSFRSKLAECIAGAVHLRPNTFDFSRETLQLRVATFDFLHPRGCAPSARRLWFFGTRAPARPPNAITSSIEPPYLRFNVSNTETRCSSAVSCS